MRRFRLGHALRTGMWVVPLGCIAAGLGLAIASVAIDRRSGYDLVPRSVTGSAADVQTVLSTFATSMVTLTGLVLTMTLVVVQLAIGQFSPRIVRSLLEGHPSQVVLGVFGATFVQSVVALREVQLGGSESVPGLAVLIAYGLMLGSIVTLVLYVHKVGTALRVSSLIDVVGERTHALVQELYPTRDGAPSAGGTIAAPKAGTVYHVDRERLVDAARAADCVLELVPAIGDFVPQGAPLFFVHGDARRLRSEEVTRLVAVGRERTLDEDIAYGIRLLVDIGERGLTQPFNDPTTTVQAIHRLHDCLRQLAPRPFPSGRWYDDAAEVRLITRVLDWDGYVRLAFDELRIAGAASPQVPRRLREALLDLKTVAPPDRQEALDRQLELLDAAVERELDDEHDAAAAQIPDRQGIGSGADLVAPGG